MLENGLQLAAILFSDLAAKDHGDLVGLTEGTVGVQEALAHAIESNSGDGK